MISSYASICSQEKKTFKDATKIKIKLDETT